jgi:NADH-quinone oxidoreductase subunit J
MDWIGQHWLDWASLLLIAAGVWWLLPRAARRPKFVGLVLALAGVGLLATRIDDMSAPIAETALFWLFAGAAILSAVLMITNRNPVYSALWFAVVTLNVCGLFLLQFAPFLAAATVVVYAGAIVVTFVFVIMLAQQAGATAYDQRSRQPLVATIAAFALLAAIVGTLRLASESSGGGVSNVAAVDVANPFSQLPPDAKPQAMGRMHALGRSLFGDYLFAVELAGTLLLVATIGAIAIAPRRRGGTL